MPVQSAHKLHAAHDRPVHLRHQCHKPADPLTLTQIKTRRSRASKLPHLVLSLDNSLPTLSRVLPRINSALPRRLEEQTRSLALGDQIAQITPMRRVTVILEILPARRIRQSVPESLLRERSERGHDVDIARLLCRRTRFFFERKDAALQAFERMTVAFEHALDRWACVVARRNGAASCFDGGDGGRRGPAYNDVDWCGESHGAAGEQFDAVFDAVDDVGGV